MSPSSVFVALYTSAWIEIAMDADEYLRHAVALYTSAWIEMNDGSHVANFSSVALYTSAWIEIRTNWQP